ncbi:MAG: LysR family transcriptional regulator [Acidiferrobacterales bacterium]
MDSVAGMRIFVRVVDSGSFSAAGRQLDVAPSSVSRQINELEEELGARLFHRTTRKLSLTEAGQLYYERAARILMEVDEAKLALSQMDGTPSGILRLTVAASIARLHIVPALTAFQQKFPAVKIVLAVTDRLVDLVDEGFDLGIRVGRPRDSSLVARKIGSGRRIVCASPAYLRKAGTLQVPADLVNHNCLTFRAHPGSNVWSFKARKGTSNIRVSGSLFADDGEALVAAAVAGAGLILMPAWLVGMYIRQGQLREVLPKFQVAPKDTPLYALYPHQRHLPPKVRAFIDFLVERFAREVGWDGSASPHFSPGIVARARRSP